MAKPWYQKLLTPIYWFLTAVLFFGAVLDTISNSLELITPTIAYIGSLVIVVGLLILELYLRRYPLLWITKDGQAIRLKSMWPWLHILALGVVVSLWIPIMFNNLHPRPAPDLKAQLLLRISGFEIKITNSGQSVATGIRVAVNGWQPGSPGLEIMERHSIPDLGPVSDFTVYRVLPPRTNTVPWRSRSGYIMVTCTNCERPKGWAFYIPEWGSEEEKQFRSEFYRSGSWPLAVFSYPDKKPGIGNCVNYPHGVCEREYPHLIWTPEVVLQPAVTLRGRAQPNNSFNRSAKSAAFIH